ncbi:hypothetical protein [Pseudomonas sp. 2822-17]|uniref:hypothetical protein n=1 Tax=Pseudomonas TaxID=286 RepID=UPI000C14A1D9|nr:hypothetical protein [Pseudomonas sp. 2822-17]PIB49333.1 hypothetical protein AOA60_28590 [Pseudomonas sp. 2822-17]
MQYRLIESIQVLKESQEVILKSVAGLIQTIRLTEQKMSVLARDVRNFDKSGLESLEGQLYILAVEIDSMRDLAFKELSLLSNKIDTCLNMIAEEVDLVGSEVEGSLFSTLFSQCLLQLEGFKLQVEYFRQNIN